MPTVPGGLPFADLACRWHALAQRRLAHYDELYRSGRWRHYYPTHEQFAAHLLEAIRAAAIWAELADRRPAVTRPPASTERDLRSAA